MFPYDFPLSFRAPAARARSVRSQRERASVRNYCRRRGINFRPRRRETIEPPSLLFLLSASPFVTDFDRTLGLEKLDSAGVSRGHPTL